MSRRVVIRHGPAPSDQVRPAVKDFLAQLNVILANRTLRLTNPRFTLDPRQSAAFDALSAVMTFLDRLGVHDDRLQLFGDQAMAFAQGGQGDQPDLHRYQLSSNRPAATGFRAQLLAWAGSASQAFHREGKRAEQSDREAAESLAWIADIEAVVERYGDPPSWQTVKKARLALEAGHDTDPIVQFARTIPVPEGNPEEKADWFRASLKQGSGSFSG